MYNIGLLVSIISVIRTNMYNWLIFNHFSALTRLFICTNVMTHIQSILFDFIFEITGALIALFGIIIYTLYSQIQNCLNSIHDLEMKMNDRFLERESIMELIRREKKICKMQLDDIKTDIKSGLKNKKSYKKENIKKDD